MTQHSYDKLLPRYQGIDWLDVEFPAVAASWMDGKWRSLRKRKLGHNKAREELSTLLSRYPWQWPKRPVFFFSDPHADAQAMISSLVASGGVKKTGPKDKHFRLTKDGRQALFLVGGDCFDKGPSNLRLLRILQALLARGASLRILAGNHDLRVMLGMRSVGVDNGVANEHFFIRMGTKVIPFLKEIYDQYPNIGGRDLPSEKACRQLLYPSERWFDEFPALAADLLPARTIERELLRIRAKIDGFEHACDAAGLSLPVVYAAARQWQTLFLQPSGEFNWFFKQMRLAIRKGSFLFIHAGLDDDIAELISEKGVKHLNRQFRRQLNGSGFGFYYGAIANAIRTKYRVVDRPLSKRGAAKAHGSGIHAIVHGHRNLLHGQRIALRKGMVNFECDITMDCNSRRKEGLEGPGAGVTLIHPNGWVAGISTDYAQAKIFDPLALTAKDA